ncbi:MAG: extracellular solute-binding protein [Chloroflexota bacterium]
MDRRIFLHQLARGALLTMGASLATACRPAPAAAPTSGSAAPARTSAAVAESQSASGYHVPTFVPFAGPKPDIEGAPNGLPPTYSAYPSQPVTTVSTPPGRGGDIALMNFTTAPVPPGVDQNLAWQEVNRQVGATLRINAVGAPDYLTKLNTTIASGNLPDMFYASVIGTGLQNMPEFLAKQCADLTPFLAGDAIREFPNIAALPSFRWRYGVFAGKLYAIPAAVQTGQAMLAKGRILDREGISSIANAAEFLQLAKQLTQPGLQYALGGTGAGYNSWNPLGWFMGVFRTPTDWQLRDGKLSKDIETDEFEAAVAFVRRLWDAGVINPDAPGMNLTQTAAAWYSGKTVLWQNAYSTFNLAWDRAVAQDAEFRPRILSPFGHDGGAAVHLLSSTADSLTVFKKAVPERIRELLGVMNFMVAPFGSTEYTVLNYGLEGRDYARDGRGNPVLTKTGAAEVTSFPIWKMAAPPPVVFSSADPTFGPVASQAQARALAVGQASPVAGLYSKTASQKSALLNQPLTDGLYGIMFGRQSVSTLADLVKQWRVNGGDQIRAELEQVLQDNA